MKTMRSKALALLSAGMVLQIGGCSMTDVIGSALSDGASDFLATLLGG